MVKRLPGGSDGKASACNAGDPGSIPGLGRSPGEGNGNPLQYPCLENPMDGEAWQATVHGVAKSQTRLSDFTFTFYSFTKEEKSQIQLVSTFSFLHRGNHQPKVVCLKKSHSIPVFIYIKHVYVSINNMQHCFLCSYN